MYNDDSEILFPSRAIPLLKGLHGNKWDALLDQITLAGETSPDHIAFVLLMVKLGGCATCNADSFRAMKGCTQCARQTIRRFRGGEDALLQYYQASLAETRQYLANPKT